MGIKYEDAHIESILTSLGFELAPTADGWQVEIPYWRSDITIPEDLIEEVARIGGYDTLATTNLSGSMPPSSDQQAGAFRRRVADAMAAMGANQIVSYVATSAERAALGGRRPRIAGTVNDRESRVIQPRRLTHDTARRGYRSGSAQHTDLARTGSLV